MTYTYATMAVSPEVHAEIKAKLIEAGYQHAIDGDTLDMHGIGLVVEELTPVKPWKYDFPNCLCDDCCEEAVKRGEFKKWSDANPVVLK